MSDDDSTDEEHGHDVHLDNTDKFFKLRRLGFTEGDKEWSRSVSKELSISEAFVGTLEVCRALTFIQLRLRKVSAQNSKFPFCCLERSSEKPLVTFAANFVPANLEASGHRLTMRGQFP